MTSGTYTVSYASKSDPGLNDISLRIDSSSVVDSFVARCAADDRINRKFARTDVPPLKQMLVDQVCEATGGPCSYLGKDMVAAHKGMKISDAEWDATVQDLIQAMVNKGVPEKERNELIGLLAPMKKDIVNQ